MKVQDHQKVGHEKWGKYAAIFALCHICTFLLDLGINQLITKSIANNEESTTPIALVIKLITSLLFPFLMIGIGWAMGYRSNLDLILLGSISLIHVFIQLSGFFRAIIQGNQLFGIDAWLSNLDKVALVILVFSLLLINYIDLSLFINIRILAIVISTVVGIYIVWKKKLISFNRKLKLSKSKEFIKSGLPFAFIMLVYGLNETIDQLMVERLAISNKEFSQAGIYAAAYRLVNAVMMYLWIVLPIFFAKFAHHETNNENKSQLLKTGTAIVFLPVAFISIFSIFHGHFIFELIFNNSTAKETEGMNSVFGILCFTLIAQGLFAILSTFLTSTGHEKFVTKLVVLSVIFNLTCNFIFIPENGAYAAAWTTLGSAIIVVLGYIIYILKNNLIRLPYSIWLKLISISVLSSSVFYLFKNISDVYSIISGTITFVVCILVFRPITIKELKSIK